MTEKSCDTCTFLDGYQCVLHHGSADCPLDDYKYWKEKKVCPHCGEELLE